MSPLEPFAHDSPVLGQMRELLGSGGKYPLIDAEQFPLQATPQVGEVDG